MRFDKVSKAYLQKERETKVLSDVSFDFEQGKSYAIIGPSGSGKSTCIHLLAGVDSPTHGAVYFNQENIEQFSAAQATMFLQKDISLVFQKPALLDELSVLENVMLKAIVSQALDVNSYERAHELLRQVGLEDKAYLYPSALSGGQQQRVAILRAIFFVPKFLLVDEPTGNLDDQTGMQVMQLLISYQKEYGMGLIMSTHNLQFAGFMDCVLQVESYKLHKIKI